MTVNGARSVDFRRHLSGSWHPWVIQYVAKFDVSVVTNMDFNIKTFFVKILILFLHYISLSLASIPTWMVSSYQNQRIACVYWLQQVYFDLSKGWRINVVRADVLSNQRSPTLVFYSGVLSFRASHTIFSPPAQPAQPQRQRKRSQKNKLIFLKSSISTFLIEKNIIFL